MLTRYKTGLKIACSVCFLVFAFLLCAGPPPTVSAAPAAGEATFSDLAADSSLWPYVRYITGKGVLKGFPDGTFRPAEGVTRAQAAMVMVKVKGLSPQSGGSPTFSDLSTDYWAFGEIEAAVSAGLLRGYPDGTFNPDGNITRAEAITLLLNLSGGALSSKAKIIADVEPGHWAYRQVVTAVEAGLVEMSADNLFGPDLVFSRGDLARCISAMYTLSPSLRYADLSGTLIVKKGKVTLAVDGGAPREITGDVPVAAGANINTGEDGQAEILFDDGSGIRIEANTEIAFTKGRGFNYMRRDGSPGVALDKLVLNLKNGKIFGLLASRHESTGQPAPANKTSYSGGVAGTTVLLASNGTPPDIFDLLLAEAEADSQENQETAWWAEPYTKRERVEVDMPWGVAGIRGSSWENSVGSQGQTTSVLTGEGTFSSGGATTTVGAGQSTTVSSAGAPPTPPAPMSPTQSQEFAQVSGFLSERAQAAQNNVPQPPAPSIQPASVVAQQQQEQQQQQQQEQQQQSQQQQQQSPANIMGAISQALGSTTTSTSTTGNTSTNSGSNGGRSGGTTQPEEHTTLPPGDLQEDLSNSYNGGNIVVNIPAGATLEPGAGTTVRVLSTPPAPPSGAQIAGEMVDINITGMPAGTPVKISLKAWPGKNKVGIYYYNQNTSSWEYIDSALEQLTRLVSAEVSHFSIYAVLEDTTPPSVVNSDPADNAKDVSVGKTIAITFNEAIQPGPSFQGISLLDQNNQGFGINASVNGNQLIVQPTDNLAYSGEYILQIPRGSVADRFGNALHNDRSIYFKTKLPGVNLKGLVLSSGELKPDFDGSATAYNTIIQNSVERITVTPTPADPRAAATVNGAAVAGGSSSAPIDLKIGDNLITIVVTSQDGKATKTYTVTATRSGGADLDSLVLSAGTLAPEFNATLANYTATVDKNVESITVTPTAADAKTTITVNGTAVAGGSPSAAINLSFGNNTITVIATAMDGKTTRTYNVTVTRLGGTDLVGLSLSAGTLKLDFDSATASYTATVDSSVESITVTPAAVDPRATITVNGSAVNSGKPSTLINLNAGDNTVTIVVTGQDGKTTRTYTVTVMKVDKTGLTGLAVSAGGLSPAFDQGTTSYSVSVDNSVDSITLTPTAADSKATITVNGTTVPSGSVYTLAALSEGDNTITVLVTAGDGKTTKTYNITVSRANKPQPPPPPPPVTTTGTINGKVTYGGYPIIAVTVTVTVNGTDYTATTAADGTYSISNVPVGTGYIITASIMGYQGTATGVSVTAGQTTSNINIILSAFNAPYLFNDVTTVTADESFSQTFNLIITGDTAKSGISTGDITLGGDLSGLTVAGVTKNENGTVSVHVTGNLARTTGTGTIKITAGGLTNGVESQTVSLKIVLHVTAGVTLRSATQSEVDLLKTSGNDPNLAAGGALNVDQSSSQPPAIRTAASYKFVAWSTDSPYPTSNLDLFIPSGVTSFPPAFDAPDQYFTMPTGAGTFYVLVLFLDSNKQLIGYYQTPVAVVFSAPGDLNTATISGTVTSSATGNAAISGATVAVYQIDGITAVTGATATTDVNGTYTINNVPVGSIYVVKFSAAGYTASQAAEVNVSSGVTTTVDKQMDPSYTASFLLGATTNIAQFTVEFSNKLESSVTFNTNVGDIIKGSVIKNYGVGDIAVNSISWDVTNINSPKLFINVNPAVNLDPTSYWIKTSFVGNAVKFFGIDISANSLSRSTGSVEALLVQQVKLEAGLSADSTKAQATLDVLKDGISVGLQNIIEGNATAYQNAIALNSTLSTISDLQSIINSVNNNTPADANSGITLVIPGAAGSKQDTLAITVQNATGTGLTSLTAADFTAKINGGEPVTFGNAAFSNFTELGNGQYAVVYTGMADNTEYLFTNLTAKGVLIDAGPWSVVTPSAALTVTSFSATADNLVAGSSGAWTLTVRPAIALVMADTVTITTTDTEFSLNGLADGDFTATVDGSNVKTSATVVDNLNGTHKVAIVLSSDVATTKDLVIGIVGSEITNPAAGTYADAFKIVTSKDTVTKSASVSILTTTGPDLTITTGTPTASPTSVTPGSSITLSGWTVKNIGTVESGGFSNRFYLSSDSVITANDTYLDGNGNFSLLPGGEFSWGSPTLTIPEGTQPGSYYLGIMVDYNNFVTESNETNNYVSVPITVISP